MTRLLTAICRPWLRLRLWLLELELSQLHAYALQNEMRGGPLGVAMARRVREHHAPLLTAEIARLERLVK